MKRIFVLALLVLAATVTTAFHAQGYLSWGLSLTGKYDTSTFDSIGEDHHLVIHIPVYSLKEKGSLPPFSISLVQNSPTWDVVTSQYGATSTSLDTGTGRYDSKQGVMPVLTYGLGYDTEPVQYQDPNTENTYAYGVNYVVDSLGATTNYILSWVRVHGLRSMVRSTPGFLANLHIPTQPVISITRTVSRTETTTR